MSSQRVREARIGKKLRSGALAPAPVTALEMKPSQAGQCLGCDEPEADALVGDQPWHALCSLYWQGRSETDRARHASKPRTDAFVVPERSRWVIVVRADRAAVFATLHRNFAGSAWVDVVKDRRGRPSAGSARPPTIERRHLPRRPGSPGSTPAPAFYLTYQGVDFTVYEATAPLSSGCPHCGLVVTMELPRFAEPPVRLELTVIHEVMPPATIQHVVEAQARSGTGRVILASRLRARPLNPT